MKIYVLANTILLKSAISGGDILLPRAAKYWPSEDEIIVITNKIGQKLWQRNKITAKFLLTKDCCLEERQSLLFGPVKYILRTVQALKLLSNQLKKNKELVIIYTSSDFFPDVIPAFIARKKFPNTKWLARVYHFIQPPGKRRGSFFANAFSYFSQRTGLYLIKRSADKIACLDGAYNDLVKFGINKNKITTSNAGVAVTQIEQLKPADKSYEAISVGNLTPSRGANDLIAIWKKVVENIPDAKLAVVGGGAKKFIKVWRVKIKKANLENNIDYLGFIPENHKVYQLMKASQLYLHTAHEGGWSLPITESMAVGTPAVSYRLPLLKTALNQSTTTVSCYDQAAYAQKVVQLLKNDSVREKRAKLAKEEAQKYRWSAVAKKLHNLMGKMSDD